MENKQQPPIESGYVYVEKDITEEPTEEGRYIVSNGFGWLEADWEKELGFHEEFTDCSGLTKWLCKVPVNDLVVSVQEDSSPVATLRSGVGGDYCSFCGGLGYVPDAAPFHTIRCSNCMGNGWAPK